MMASFRRLSVAVAASRLGPILAVSWLLLAPAGVAGETRNVLVIYSNTRLLPANVAADRGLREAITSSADRRVEFYAEFLDAPHFGGKAHDDTFAAYLSEKYSARPPDAIVVAAEEALVFLLSYRARLFPRAPAVHMAVARSFLRSIPPLPADVAGVPIEYDFSGTIEQALRWHSKARRVVVVTGAAAQDRQWEARLRGEVSRFGNRATIEFLAGLPTGAVLKRLGELGSDAVVFTPGYFQDGEGRIFTPRKSAEIMAAAATAPVYGPFDTFIGAGIVGGRMPSFDAMGRQAAQVVNALFAGAAPSSLHLPEIMPSRPNVDWGQVRRWGIAERDLPAGTIVHFRGPAFWEAYRKQAIVAIVVFLIQAGLIAALLVERRLRLRTAAARKVAERQAGQDRAALLHMTRVSMLGQLSASITHQLSQPLTAILSNAEAAQKMLGRERVDLEELKEICADIVTEDHRAADVIHRMGALFKRGELKLRPLDVNELVRDTLDLMRTDFLTRHVTPVTELGPSLPTISGDRVQLQQVLLNLILNAADAMNAAEVGQRKVTIRTEANGAGVRLSVADRGPGIAAEDLHNVFEPFWSTKTGGMGIGLAICRSIATAHGGTLTAANAPGGGATFCATLPAGEQA